MKERYQIREKRETKEIADHLSKNGQLIIPMMELIQTSQAAVDELIDVLGRATIEAVLTISAAEVAGSKHQGKAGGEINWHGSQKGTVQLRDRKVKVNRPRLRRKGGGNGSEVSIPAYERMSSHGRMGEQVLNVLMKNVSTRNYKKVIPEMAETVGVSRSSVSREFIDSSEEQLRELMERRFEDIELLAIYLDGIVFGDHHIICALGVDATGSKHILGIAEGSSENAVAVTNLLSSIVERGVDPGRRYLFVIDGSKALRKGIDDVFGKENPVQRCRNHKIKNVTDNLPDDIADQVKRVMKAAYRLPYKEGIAKLKQQASWLEIEFPGASASLLEGLEETFTINKLDLSPSLRRCLGTTNIIESPNSGVRYRTNRVCRWRDGKMIMRWAASAFLDTERSFRKIQGYKDLWMLKASLNDQVSLASDRRVA